MHRKEWSLSDWQMRESILGNRLDRCVDTSFSRNIIVRHARGVMRHYTTGFFIVSRFLPKTKRDDVELIYAAVRYPDEVVDTFAIPNKRKLELLEQWRTAYETAIQADSLDAALHKKVPPFVAAFADLVKRHSIPMSYYNSFLDAMALDVEPESFQTLDDLIENYVYGSAIVVGYFLTHVYGAASERSFPDAMESARNLGIGLQLTNFLRDVREDARRGRTYLPLDILRNHGIDTFDPQDRHQQESLKSVLRELTRVSDGYYERSFQTLEAFHPDCRVAIKACIDVYRMLNTRIANSDRGIDHRESVPLLEKLKPLPASKYWRIPLAYLSFENQV